VTIYNHVQVCNFVINDLSASINLVFFFIYLYLCGILDWWERTFHFVLSTQQDPELSLLFTCSFCGLLLLCVALPTAFGHSLISCVSNINIACSLSDPSFHGRLKADSHSIPLLAPADNFKQIFAFNKKIARESKGHYTN